MKQKPVKSNEKISTKEAPKPHDQTSQQGITKENFFAALKKVCRPNQPKDEKGKSKT